MREGDYYRWRYKVPPDHMPYHCASRIALFTKMALRDTYWYSRDGKAWDELDAINELELELVANLDELDEVSSKGVHEDHRPEDIVDLTHPNGGHIYLRKGAERNMAVQHATWRRKRDEHQSRADGFQCMIDTFPEEVEHTPA